MSTRGFLVLTALGTTIVGCSAILGLQEPTVDDSIEGGGGPDSGTTDGIASDVGKDGIVVDSACGADLQTDGKNCGTCGHDCLGGSCSAGVCQPVLVASSTSIAPYAMVLSGSTLYFTNIQGSKFSSVWTVDKTATNGTPKQLVDYSTAYTTPLVSGYPYGIALQGGDFYVSLSANSGSGAYWEAGIDRCPTTGCTQNTLAYYGINSYAVVTNSANVFFASADINDTYTVVQASFDLQTVRKTLATPTSEVNGLAVDNSDLFYATSEGVFHCAGTTCGTSSIIQGQAIDDAEELALDATNVYFTSTPYQGTPNVQSVPRAGGAPKLLSSKPALPFTVVADGPNLYFSDVGDTSNSTTGAVYQCPITACNKAEVTLSTGKAAGDNPRPIVVDATAIYWGTRGGSIWRLAK